MTDKLSASSPRSRLLRFVCALLVPCLCLPQGKADTATVVSDANTLTSNASSVSTAYSLSTAKQWTNLPGGTRNGPTIGGGALATSSDVSAAARTAVLQLCMDALSVAGYNTMNEIRLADDIIRSSTAGSGQSWNYSNYHIATLGTPSTSAAWMLQISGHHLTYNNTYNGPYVNATPMFLGTEPTEYYRLPSTNATYPNYAVVKGTINGTTSYYISNPDKTANGSSSNVTIATTDPGVSSATKHAPLETQRAAVSALAASLQADNTGAKLSGTYSDVVMGVTNNGDGNFPFINTNPTYPTGTSGRGLLYSSLTSTEKAQVKAVIEAWVNTQASDVSNSLLADYESEAALAVTYVGYQVGSGSADGGSTRANFDADIYTESTPINSQNSYLRIDGPRAWIEFVVQASVAYNTQKWVHYHSLYRDKLADYGNEFGGYLDTTSTSTAYTRPAITTAPVSASIDEGGNYTFSVAATGTATLNYQWYKDNTVISGAMASTYTVANAMIADASSYNVLVTNLYGATASVSATLTVAGVGVTAPTITAQPASLSVAVGAKAAFTVGAAGSGTLAYQWYKDGTAIAGATSATYTIASAASTDAGGYAVVVTNSAGSATSNTATLTVSASSTAPSITSQPTSREAVVGASTVFTVTAAGTAPLSYQWYKDGAAISGATAASYAIAAAASGDAGTYYAVVTNSAGAATSASVTLTVTAMPVAVAPTVSIAAPGNRQLSEDGKKGRVIFTRSDSDNTADLTIYYQIKGRATNKKDYRGPDNKSLSGTVVIPAGASSYKLKITARDDLKIEGIETIKIVLSASPTGDYTVGTPAAAKLFLIDND